MGPDRRRPLCSGSTSYPSPALTLTLPGQAGRSKWVWRLLHTSVGKYLCVKKVPVLDPGQSHAQKQRGLSATKPKSKKRSRLMVAAPGILFHLYFLKEKPRTLTRDQGDGCSTPSLIASRPLSDMKLHLVSLSFVRTERRQLKKRSPAQCSVKPAKFLRLGFWWCRASASEEG